MAGTRAECSHSVPGHIEAKKEGANPVSGRKTERKRWQGLLETPTTGPLRLALFLLISKWILSEAWQV